MSATCAGVGTPATNVARGWIGGLLPMVGDCQVCGQRIRISRQWTALNHTGIRNMADDKADK
jgi:hypothetical protein